MSTRAAEDVAIAIEAARAAGVGIMAAFQTDHDVTYKSPDQPLTQADLDADALLKQMLRGARPDYGWLSEETKDTTDRLQRRCVWVVDPIDGTRSYVSGRAEFAISIGVAEDGVAVGGVVYNPATDEMFSATRGGGAFAGSTRLRLREAADRLVIAASRSEIRRGDFTAYTDSFDLLPVGSTAYKLAKVAAGEADIFLSRGPKSEWDLCAGALIVAEAGGLVTDLHGRTLQYNQPNPHIHGVLAAGSAAHGLILERIRMEA